MTKRIRSAELLSWCVLAAITLGGCALFPRNSVECTDIAPLASRSVALEAVPGSSWVYQLQSADPSSLAESEYEVAVIDYSRDGSEAGAYTSAELDAIRSAGGPSTILAYLSIGEAEDYRWYFDGSWLTVFGQPGRNAPCWLGRTNPDWAGNYKVQYWSNDWYEIVLAYVDEIVAAGFDGVYLDIIDGYEYWSDGENGEGFSIAERETADRMINLVLTIGNRARSSDAGFLVVPQNGEGILAFDDGEGDFAAGAYLDAISGIGIEDLYYDGTEPASETSVRMAFLQQVSAGDKTVFVVDYVDDGTDSTANSARIDDFTSRASADGFVPYAARSNRELDEIN